MSTPMALVVLVLGALVGLAYGRWVCYKHRWHPISMMFGVIVAACIVIATELERWTS